MIVCSDCRGEVKTSGAGALETRIDDTEETAGYTTLESAERFSLSPRGSGILPDGSGGIPAARSHGENRNLNTGQGCPVNVRLGVNMPKRVKVPLWRSFPPETESNRVTAR